MSAESVAQLDLPTAIRQGLRSRAGLEFQATAQGILRQRLPGFQAIVPHGRDGDGGNDGYSRTSGIYTQIYAATTSSLPGRQAAQKAVADFAKLKRSWAVVRRIEQYWFVTNAEGSNIHVERALSDIEKRHGIKTRFLGAHELAAEVAAMPRARIEALMGFAVRERTSAKRGSQGLKLLASVTSPQLIGLHLLASIHHPVPTTLCEQLLPRATNWPALWSWLLRRGVAQRSNGLVVLDEVVAAQCRRNTAEQRKACALWVPVLQKYGSIDCLYLAILPLLTLRRHQDAIRVVIRAGLEFGETEWDGSILQVLDFLSNSPVLARVPKTDRKALRIARANLLTRTGRHGEAVAAFNVCLRTTAEWPKGVNRGEILIDCGIASHRNGDDGQAQRRYNEAINWARIRRDDWVLGRAATNLAQSFDTTDPEAAERLINEAEAAKLRCGDVEGLVGIAMARGRLAAFRNDPAHAHRHFTAALRLAKVIGKDDVQANIFFNLGKSSGEMQQWRRATSEYRRSLAEAIKRSQAHLEARARVGLAHAFYVLEEWRACKRQCAWLAQLPAKEPWASLRLTGLHGSIVLQLRAEGVARASAVVKALAFARRSGQQEWIGRLLVDSLLGRSVFPTSKELGTLLNSGEKETKVGRYHVAAHVFSAVWQWCSSHNDAPPGVGDRAKATLARLVQNRATPISIAIEYAKRQYGMYMQTGRPWGALEALRSYAKRAYGAKLWNDYASALDQQALTLGELERYGAAESLHRQALRIAIRHRLHERQRVSAGNLAECLRRRGRIKDAYRISRQAIALHNEERDPAGYVAALHNHYLIQHTLLHKEAVRTLRRCRSLARKHGLAQETVRILVAQGNAAWDRGDMKRARAFFQGALQLSLRARIAAAATDCRYNLAMILRKAGRPREALRTLRGIGDMQEASPERMHQASLMALLLEECADLRTAASAWHEAARLAVVLKVPNLQAYYEVCARFVGMLGDRAARRPKTIVRPAERLLRAVYGAKCGSHDQQLRFNKADAFFERHQLVPYQVHMYSTIATQLADRGRASGLIAAVQASLTSILVGASDLTGAPIAMEMHLHWLLSLGLSRAKLQKLRGRTSTWLAAQLARSGNGDLAVPLLAGFDAAITLSRR